MMLRGFPIGTQVDGRSAHEPLATAPRPIERLADGAPWAATADLALDVDVGDVIHGAAGQHEIATRRRYHVAHDTTA